MTITNRLKFWIYDLVEPLFRKLELAVKDHARRLANRKAYAEGVLRWKAFKERQHQGGITENALHNRPVYVSHKDRVANCTHLKGGGVRGLFKDYNVSVHTFPDRTSRIRCLGSCGRVWLPTDPDWADALKMVETSTNTPTSSEIAARFEEKR